MSRADSPITRVGRQARIVEVLSAEPVRSQTELAALLAADGIEVTQATLSRDLEELGAVKLRGPDGESAGTSFPKTATRCVWRRHRPAVPAAGELLVSTDATGNLAVLRTRPARRTTWPVPSTGPRYRTSSAPSPGMTPSSWQRASR